MKLEMNFESCRVEGVLDGKPFVVSQKGCETAISGPFGSDDKTFADMLSSRLLDFSADVLRAMNIVIDETDRLDIWAELPEGVAEEVYDELT